jgi:hypothetical protein
MLWLRPVFISPISGLLYRSPNETASIYDDSIRNELGESTSWFGVIRSVLQMQGH